MCQGIISTLLSQHYYREGRSVMVEACRLAITVACRAVQTKFEAVFQINIMYLPSQLWDIVQFNSVYLCLKHTCRILTSFSLGGSYPRLLGREKLWTTASFPYLGDGRTQLQPMRYWYFSRTSDVTLGDYGRAVVRSL